MGKMRSWMKRFWENMGGISDLIGPVANLNIYDQVQVGGALISLDKMERFFTLKDWRNGGIDGAVVNLGREASEER